MCLCMRGFQGQQRQQLLVVRSSTVAWCVHCRRLIERDAPKPMGNEPQARCCRQSACVLFPHSMWHIPLASVHVAQLQG